MRVLLALLVSALALPSYGSAIFTDGNHPQPGEQNVLFNTDQTGAFITGISDSTGTIVDFLSTTDLLVVTNGQPNITAKDGLIEDLTIKLEGSGGFLDLILNPSAANKTDSGITTVTAYLKSGGVDKYQYPGDLSNGQNYLTITTSGSDVISSVKIDSEWGFQDLKQVRVSGITTSSIPEPDSMALIGGGLLLLAPFLRRRRA